MQQRDFEVADARQWSAVAQVLVPWVRVGHWAALEGPLGAGKTTFVQALMQCLGANGAEVTSPTFALYHDYATTPPVRHYDLYRAGRDLAANDDRGLAGLDWEPLAWGNRFVLVEWSDRLPAGVPEPLWTLSIRPVAGAAGGRQARWRLQGS